MADKKYSAADIPVLKAENTYLELVDISYNRFKENLDQAIVRAVEFAKTLVINTLPDRIQFIVFLGASYDSELQEGEITYPDDYLDVERLRESVEDVFPLLWREGSVPEWVNIYVESCDEKFTRVRLDCCGRFSSQPEKMYHAHEGLAPFHVLGPPRPKGAEQGEKFQLN
ncbi:hypothetical protein [Agarilytica rhodophyticola]|uniref:hypothetical protein n=1 Tax=Agarilytica rhodophyticola TaxID=1737490 RepID=UPI000B34443C|nr:hypothetical protein [Agarilytica rhodophyticola]